VNKHVIKKYLPYAIYLTVALAVILPLFGHGYVFLLDMVFPPDLSVPIIANDIIPTHYPIRAILYGFGLILGAPLTVKLLLSLTLLLPGVAMYRLARKHMATELAVLAGLIYMMNPWVYERFFSGQWLVMAGYGFLPIFISYIERVLASPTRRHVAKLTIVVALYPIISLHFAYVAFLFGSVYVIGWLWKHHARITRSMWFNTFKIILAIITVGLVVNSYWLYGALHKDESTYQQIVQMDFRAFETQSDETLGIYPNVLGLYGFWSSDQVLPKEENKLWWIVPLIFLGLSLYGFMKGLRARNVLATVLGVMFIPVVVITVGYGSTLSRHVVDFLLNVLPGFKGLRETEKLGGLIAFAYAILVPFGVSFVNKKYFGDTRRNLQIACVCIACLTLLSVHSMFWGYKGAITPSGYPADWYEARSYLESQTDAEALLLPWHNYLSISFADYRRIVNPAISFFGIPVISSTTTGNAYLDSTRVSDWDKFVTLVVQGVTPLPEALEILRANNVTHIIVLKEADWQKYARIAPSDELTIVLDTLTVTLYEIK
jgi:hypothetical protein